MQMLSLIGAITAIVVMCVLAFRKMNPFIISLIGTIILVVCSGMSVLGSIFGTYTPSVGEFCGNWILVFILGSIYGKLLEITGIAKRLAATLVNLIGSRNAILAATLTCAIMVCAGISNYVLIFTVYPLISQIFKRADISRNLMPAVIYFGCSSLLTCIPGLPSIQAIMLCDTLGTSTMAAPLMCLVVGIFMLVLFYVYINAQNKRLIAKGEHYALADGEEPYDAENDDLDSLPNVWLALTPIVMLVGGVFFARRFFANATQCVVTVMFLTALFVVATNYQKVKEYTLSKAVEEGFAQCLSGVFAAAGFLAFASVMQIAPCYEYLVKGITFISQHLNGYFGAAVATGISAGITVSSLGGIAMFTGTLAEPFLHMGLNMSALHRVVQIATMTLDSLPWCSNIIIYLMVCRCEHKGAYKHIFVTCCAIPILGTILACLLGMIGII